MDSQRKDGRVKIRILLADDHKCMRENLRSLIDRQPGMEVVSEAENACNALQCARRFKPDVVVMDIHMADLKGIEGVRQVISDCPGVKFVALSVYSNREFVERMLKAGASAYILKDCAFEELAQAVRVVADNQIYLSSTIDRSLI